MTQSQHANPAPAGDQPAASAPASDTARQAPPVAIAPEQAGSTLPPLAKENTRSDPSPAEPRPEATSRLSPLEAFQARESADVPEPAPVRPARIDPAAFLDQIEAGARRALTLSRVTLHLRPPDLGTLHIAVESREGVVSAHFHASHPAVATWLESNAGSLRSHLSGSGLTFNDLSFSAASQDGGGRSTYDRPPAPDPSPALGPQAKRPGAPQASLTKTYTGAADWRA
jgi:flagellar hook-length control protein FliK